MQEREPGSYKPLNLEAAWKDIEKSLEYASPDINAALRVAFFTGASTMFIAMLEIGPPMPIEESVAAVYKIHLQLSEFRAELMALASIAEILSSRTKKTEVVN